jgi:glycerol-3-phosphate dehydrogenase
MSQQVFERIQQSIKPPTRPSQEKLFCENASLNTPTGISQSQLARLVGQYGVAAFEIIEEAYPGELESIPETPYLWAEVRWAVRKEGVIHLDDLLMRRTRISLLCENGGQKWMDQIRPICQQEMGWTYLDWENEYLRYQQIWQQYYSPQPGIIVKKL